MSRLPAGRLATSSPWQTMHAPPSSTRNAATCQNNGTAAVKTVTRIAAKAPMQSSAREAARGKLPPNVTMNVNRYTARGSSHNRGTTATSWHNWFVVAAEQPGPAC